jgi:redox-sensitive bicupin YhaK (pirin superfamily)
MILAARSLIENTGLEVNEKIFLVLNGRLEFPGTQEPGIILAKRDFCRFVPPADGHYTLRNPSEQTPVEFLEITFEAVPVEVGPLIQTGSLKSEGGRRTMLPVASGQGHVDTLVLQADAALYHSKLRPNENLIFETVRSRQLLLLILTGAVRVGKQRLLPKDSACLREEDTVSIGAQQASEFLLVDLP